MTEACYRWVVFNSSSNNVVGVFSSEEAIQDWLTSLNWQIVTQEMPAKTIDHDRLAMERALKPVMSTVSFHTKRGIEVVPAWTRYTVVWKYDSQVYNRSATDRERVEEWVANGGPYFWKSYELDNPALELADDDDDSDESYDPYDYE